MSPQPRRNDSQSESQNGQSKERKPLREVIKAEHPDWNDEKISEEVTRRRGIEKRQRFETIAVRRTRAALRSIESLSRCFNRNQYTYRDDEAAKILATIEEKVDGLRHAMQGTRREADEFVL